MKLYLLLIIISASSGVINLSHATESLFLLECRVPNSSFSESIYVNLTQEEREELKVEGRCFLACATQQYQIHQVHINTRPCMKAQYRFTL